MHKRKTNNEIELECSLTWLDVYREMGVTGWRWLAMRYHVYELRRRVAGKINA